MQASQKLKRLYPRRILTARYEDLAERPLDFSARLLDFVGLHMDSRLRQYVWKITSSHHNIKEERWKTARSNSKAAASRWRENIRFRLSEEVDNKCSDLYNHLGYLPFANETTLRNLAVPYYRVLTEVPGLWTA